MGRFAIVLAVMVWSPLLAADTLAGAEPAAVTISITVNIQPVVSSVDAALRLAADSDHHTLDARCLELLGQQSNSGYDAHFRVDATNHYRCSVVMQSTPETDRAPLTVVIAST